MTDASRHDDWASGDSYDSYIGRWSRRIAPLFVDFVGVGAGLRWLDVGCGTGALSQTIVERCDPADLIGVEPADSFRELAKAVVTDPRVRFEAGDAAALPLDDGSRDITVSGLVLNFVPDRNKMLSEMKRVTAVDGTVAFYVWDYAGGGLELLRAFWGAAAALNPAASEFAESKRFPWCEPTYLATLLREAGLSDIRVEALETPTVFHDFNDFWRPFTLGTGPAPSYCKRLAEADREALRAKLDNSLPRSADGSIPMVARAWGVQGRV